MRPYSGCPGKALMPVARLAEQASRIFGIPADRIVGRGRKQAAVEARAAVCLVAFELGRSSVAIGIALAGRDNSTVLHARDMAGEYCRRSADYAAKVDELRAFAAGPLDAPYSGQELEAVKAAAEQRDRVIARVAREREFEPPQRTSDDFDREMRRSGTIALLAALRREHPERCIAA